MISTPRSIRERAVFLDTSAFIGLLDPTDRWHEPAERGFRRLSTERRPIVTSNLVVGETYTLLAKRVGRQPAFLWLTQLRMNVIFQQQEDHQRILDILRRYRDQDFSYTDALSFCLMDKLGVTLALTFNEDFQQYGLTLYR